MRVRYDAKTARITPPHVTLAGTYWRQGPALSANETQTMERLASVQDRLPAFDLILSGLETFLPDVAVVYLRVEPTADLSAVRQLLLDALGPDKHQRFVPHLTLTMRLTPDATQSLLQQLRQSDWHTQRFIQRLDHLWLMQRGPADTVWRFIQRVECRKQG